MRPNCPALSCSHSQMFQPQMTRHLWSIHPFTPLHKRLHASLHTCLHTGTHARAQTHTHTCAHTKAHFDCSHLVSLVTEENGMNA